jgi:hypothetical protein
MVSMLRIGDDATVGTIHIEQLQLGGSDFSQLVYALDQRVVSLENASSAPANLVSGGTGVSVPDPVVVPVSHIFDFTSGSQSTAAGQTVVTLAGGALGATSYGNSSTATWSAATGLVNGSDSGWSLPSFSFGGAFSIEFYGSIQGSASDQHPIFGAATDSSDVFYVSLGYSTIMVDAHQGQDGGAMLYLAGVGVSAPTSLIHLIVVLNGSSRPQVYFNGTLQSGDRIGEAYAIKTATRQDNIMGNGPVSSPSTVGGQTTRLFAVHGFALTDAEVLTRYNARP